MNMYRLRLSSIPNQPGKQYYPTLEVYPATAKTVTYLSHNTVPVTFTDEDFDQVKAGNLVVKVIYLQDEKFQDLAAVAGAEEVVSTRLEPGVNPLEAKNELNTVLSHWHEIQKKDLAELNNKLKAANFPTINFASK